MKQAEQANGRRDWGVIPPNRLVTITEAALVMQIERETLLCKLRQGGSGRHYVPANIEIVKEGKHTIGVRRNVE